MDKLKNLQFGINTFRLESVHLKHLIQRIFKSLSFTDKVAITRRYQSSIRDWKTVGSIAPVIHQQQLAEDLCRLTVEKVSNITQGGFCLNDLLLNVSIFLFYSNLIHFHEKFIKSSCVTISWKSTYSQVMETYIGIRVIKYTNI